MATLTGESRTSGSSSDVPVDFEVEIDGEDGNGGESASREAVNGSVTNSSCTSSGVFPFCPLPPHKDLLDDLLNNSEVDRSVSTLLNFDLIYCRVRQIGALSVPCKSKAPVCKDTSEEESGSSSIDSCSEYDPVEEMGDPKADIIEERVRKVTMEREARTMANRSRARKCTAPSGAKGNGVADCSVTTNMSNESMRPPPAKTTPTRGKVSRTHATYDVEKCARWKPPSDLDELSKAELGKLPKLLIPRDCPGFGVIGSGRKYIWHVVAPYMSFSGDTMKLGSESTMDHFETMLESSAEMFARMSFVSHAMIEKEALMEKNLAERRLEIKRLQREVQQFEAERERLADAAAAQFSMGMDKGELSGWEEACHAFLEAGYITREMVDSVVCPLTLPDDCVTLRNAWIPIVILVPLEAS